MKKMVKLLNGEKVDFDVVANYADRELWNEICDEAFSSSHKQQWVVSEYCRRHAEKFDGEVFQIN